MSVVLGLDPGTNETGWALYCPIRHKLYGFGKWANENVVLELSQPTDLFDNNAFDHCACEWMESRGMPVGQTTFETICWIGRFFQARRHERITRKEEQIHLCGSTKAGDPNIRRAIMDRFEPTGGGATPEKGTKKQPGPLYGVSGDAWQALAVAITFAETKL